MQVKPEGHSHEKASHSQIRTHPQIFDTSRKLGCQGWSFNMQSSMLEIYNEEYRDLLTKSRKDDKKHQVGQASSRSSILTLK
jgi:hypothetical protein